MYAGQVLTCGEYDTEAQSVAALLAAINPQHWVAKTEVEGWMMQPRLDTEGSGFVRIDAILKPTQFLIEQGWRWGFVGIECKRSGKKLGRVIAQAMDYTRCVWSLPNGIEVMTRFVFVWPSEPQRGDLESLMVQHRVGVASHFGNNKERLMLSFNGTTAYADKGQQTPAIANELRGGRRQGSR